MQRVKNFCFTRNNYSGTVLEDNLDCKYIIYGKEVGASGTPHLQGFVQFNNVKTLASAIACLPGCHVEISRNFEQSIEYCKKDGDFTERGKAPVSSKRKGLNEEIRWREIRLAAEEGRVDDIPEDIRFRSHNLIKSHRQDHLRRRTLVDTDMKMLWYFGETGTGKSRKAREDNPGAYLKNCNKWWDGYEDQEVVIIEDFDAAHACLAHHLKIWADRYPFNAEVKGGSFKIRPKLLIVTSNYHPSEIFTDLSALNPILRRFSVQLFKKLVSSN